MIPLFFRLNSLGSESTGGLINSLDLRILLIFDLSDIKITMKKENKNQAHSILYQ